MHCFYGAREHRTPMGASDVVVGECSFSAKLFHWASQNYILICLFDLILYVQANNFSIVFGQVFQG